MKYFRLFYCNDCAKPEEKTFFFVHFRNYLVHRVIYSVWYILPRHTVSLKDPFLLKKVVRKKIKYCISIKSIKEYYCCYLNCHGNRPQQLYGKRCSATSFSATTRCCCCSCCCFGSWVSFPLMFSVKASMQSIASASLAQCGGCPLKCSESLTINIWGGSKFLCSLQVGSFSIILSIEGVIEKETNESRPRTLR